MRLRSPSPVRFLKRAVNDPRYAETSLTEGTDRSKIGDLLHDSALLLSIELWIHWQGNDLICSSVCDGKVTGSIAKVDVGLLEMQGDRIVNARANMRVGEILLKSFSILHANDVKMVHSSGPFWFEWQNHTVDTGEQLVVSVRGFLAFAIPFPKVPQLDAQDPGLDRIQAAVVAFHIVVILF